MKTKLRIALGCTIVAALFVSVGIIGQVGGENGIKKVSVPKNGAYVGLTPAADVGAAEISRYEQKLGRGFDIQRVYSDQANPNITNGNSPVQDAVRHNRIPWLSITTGRWDKVASGHHDNQIDALANDIKTLGVPIYLTLNHEPEDDLNNQQTVDSYRAMWQRYHDRFTSLGVENVSWSYVVRDSSLEKDNPFYANATAMYPGDNFVDWIGIDSFNMPYDVSTGYDYCKNQETIQENKDKPKNEPKAQNTEDLIANRDKYPCQAQRYAETALDTQWRDLDDRIKGAYTWVSQDKPGSHTMPMALSDWGTTYDWRNDGRRSQWLDAASQDLKSMPLVKAIVYSNSAEWRLGWPENQNQDADVAVFASFVSEPYYNPRNTPPPDITPPTVQMIEPTPGTYSGVLKGVAEVSDNVGVDRVALLSNGNWLFTDYEAPYEYTKDTTTSTDGPYALTTIAYDSAGNSTESAPLNIVIDNFAQGEQPSITSLTVEPKKIQVGQTATLTWTTHAARSCSISPAGPQETPDTTWTTPIQQSTGTIIYTLTCSNLNGSVTKEVSLEIAPLPMPPPKPVFGSSSTAIKSGESVLFSWTSTGATSCTFNPGNITSTNNGTKLVNNITQTTTFYLSCRNDDGVTAADPITVTVMENPPPAPPEILVFRAAPDRLTSGGTSVITWQTSNVPTNGCNISPSPFLSIPASGQGITPYLTASRTYTLTCQNEVGQIATASLSIIVDDMPPPPAPPPNPPVDVDGAFTKEERILVDPVTKIKIANAEADDEVVQGMPLTLSDKVITSQPFAEKLIKVEFYIDGKLVQTITEPPFALDTSKLEPGTYAVTERLYFKDGTVGVLSQNIITVVPDKPEWLGWSVVGVIVVMSLAAVGVFIYQIRATHSKK